MRTDIFENRHIGPSGEETRNMLAKLGVDSTDELINQTIPGDIRLKNPLPVGEGLSEFEYHAHLRKLEAENKLYKSYIGLGYHGTITPAVIQRNILENPGWVYCLHSLSGGNFPGPAGSFVKLPDSRFRPDRTSGCKCLIA
jgi:glycine dehydrogenase